MRLEDLLHSMQHACVVRPDQVDTAAGGGGGWKELKGVGGG